jgi:glycosyltransferase involved in cell wall biosynthesis
LTITGEMKWPGGDAEVRKYVQALGLSEKVTFRPAFTRDQAPDVYRDAHVLLHPKDKDPCPTVPIEAMSCGLPVVGSRSGGMPELVPASCGRLVEVKESWVADHAPDPARMADCVEEVMADHQAFSAAARAHAVSAFDERQWLDRHEAIFRKVLADS